MSTTVSQTVLLAGLIIFIIGSLLIWILRLWIEIRFLRIQQETDQRWITIYADFAEKSLNKSV